MQAGTDFVHVILTRFNLATPGRESAIRNQPGWLAGRFELFERYCLPTLAAQKGVSAGGFRWIVYFDDGTPEPFRARIEACRRVADFHPFFTPIFPGEQWGISARAVLAAEGRAAPWLLSTRLDNDDGLAVDFVGRVQAAVAAAPPRRAAFNLTNGYVFDGRRAYAHAHPSNAFASLLEPWETARTVSDVQHMDLAAAGPVVQVGGPGGWLQVVHGGNVSNKNPRPPGAAGRARRPLPGLDRARRRRLGARHRRREPAHSAAARRARPRRRPGAPAAPAGLTADILFLFLPARVACCNSGKNIPSEGTCLRVRVRSSPACGSGRASPLKSSLRMQASRSAPSIAGNAVTRRPGKLSFTCLKNS